MKSIGITSFLALPALLVSPSLAAGADPPDHILRAFQGLTEPVERSDAELQEAYAQVLASLVPKLAETDTKDAEKALNSLRAICSRSTRPGAERERAALCKAMVPHLDPSTPNVVRLLVLVQIERIGGVECVEPLTGLLDDRDLPVRQYALRGLAANPDASATAVLREALRGAQTPEARIALINALGYRPVRKPSTWRLRMKNARRSLAGSAFVVSLSCALAKRQQNRS